MRLRLALLAPPLALSLACGGLFADKEGDDTDARGDDTTAPADDSGDDTSPPEIWTPVLINFDDADGVVADRYGNRVTVTSQPGFEVRTASTIPYTPSPPNFICTARSGGSLSCVEDVYLEFYRPVRDVRIEVVGSETSGVIALALVYDADGLQGEVEVVSDGDHGRGQLLDLSAFDRVTRVEIVDVTDSYGVGYDDLSFEQLDSP